MKLLLLILIFFPLFSYGQSDQLKKNYSVSELETAKEHFYVVIDDDNLIKLDSVLLFQFDAEWIEEISIVKDEADIYGNTPIRAVLIYPKKKYKKKIQRLWEIGCGKYSDKYVPIDLDDALNYLDCKWSESDKDGFKNKPENDAVTELHFGTGMGIRNSWGLWRGDSGIAQYLRNLGASHPDDMSSIILTSFHRYLNKTDIKLDEQIKFYKEYWDKLEHAEIERKRKEINEFSINDTVDFLYNNDYVSQGQEDKYMDYSCIAKGLVIAIDTVDLRLQIRLIESCDKKGIIVSNSDIFIQEGTEWISKEKDKIEIMKTGEIKWTNYDIWETLE